MEFIHDPMNLKVGTIIEKIHEISIENSKSEENDDDENDDENENENDEDEKLDGGENKSSKKKKKKKPKKKKNAAISINGTQLPKSRLLTGFTDYYIKYGQTNPPSKKVAELFPKYDFPLGEIQKHGETKYPNSIMKRVTDEEKRSTTFTVTAVLNLVHIYDVSNLI